MCGPLCDARARAQRLGADARAAGEREPLRRRARPSAPVVPLPPSLQEMLQAELERREPELVAALNRRAAAWCEANGRPEAAIEYCGRGRRHRRARAARRRDGVPVLPQRPRHDRRAVARRRSTTRRCSSTTRDRGVRRVAARAARSARRSRALGAAVEASDFDGPMPDGSPFEAWAATVRALLCSGGVEQMQADAELAVSELTARARGGLPAILLHGYRALAFGRRRSSGDPVSARRRRRHAPEARSGPGWSRIPNGRSWRSSAATSPAASRRSRSRARSSTTRPRRTTS